MAASPAHIGELSIIVTTPAGIAVTSVIQNRTASAPRPEATIALIRGPRFAGSSRGPGITYGASYAAIAADGTPAAAACRASAAPHECPDTKAPRPAARNT